MSRSMPALAGTIFLHHLVQRGAVIHGKAVGMGVLTVKRAGGLLQLADIGIRTVVASVCRRKPEFALAVQPFTIVLAPVSSYSCRAYPKLP
jgi:hypothetical protein